MTEQRRYTGAATAIGSMPGDDPAEAARIVVGEFPDFPYLPELPARGVGADMLGRTAALMVDLAVETVPSGYRVTSKPGREHRHAVDLLRWDVDALEEAVSQAGISPPAIKIQLAGPWTLAAGVELSRGHRVLTDHGAVREFAQSTMEGLRGHITELKNRFDAPIVVQFDEPALPSVLSGSLPTASGYGTVSSVPEEQARDLLRNVIDQARDMSGQPVIAHCCATRPPIALLHSAGADGIAFDVTTIDGAPASLLDEIGEAWQDGRTLLLGAVPTSQPATVPSLAEIAKPVLTLVDRLGFNRDVLRESAVATPACGLAGASMEWTRRALSLTRDLGRAFIDPPESW